MSASNLKPATLSNLNWANLLQTREIDWRISKNKLHCAAMDLKNRVIVRSSSIHGKGVFAKSRIDEESKIGTYAGVRGVTSDGTYVLWVEQDNGRVIGIEGRNELRFLNHSSQPNAEFDGEHLYALRPIEPNEEITFHYGEEWADIP